MAAILIFSDFNSIRNGFEDYFKKRNDIRIFKYRYANNCKRIQLPAENEDTYLIYEYYRKSTFSSKKESSLLEKANIIDIIHGIISPQDCKNKIKGIIVFAYDDLDPLSLYSEFEIINDLFEKEKLQNAYTIETSHIFSRIPDKSIFLKQGTDIGAVEDLKDYGKLIGSIVNSLIVKNEKKISANEELHYLHKNTLGFNQYISNLNSKYFLDGYKLTTCSFIVSEINQYLIDWPYKEYYDPQNEYIVKGISRIFKKDLKTESDYHEGCNFYYLNFCLNKKSLKPVKLLRILSYVDKNTGFIFSQGKWACPEGTDENLFSDWCYILSTSVFFRADLLNTKVWKAEDCNSCKKDCMLCDECYKVGMFWFMHRIESIEGNDLHGLLTYTFCNIYEKELKENDIVEKGKFFYNTKRPLVEIKAKDTLFPYLFSTLNKHATQAAISQVMARNMRHNIGSHVLNNFTDSKTLSNIGLQGKILRSNSYDGMQYSSQNSDVKKVVKAIVRYFSDILLIYQPAMTLQTIAQQLNKHLDLEAVLEKVKMNYPFGQELMPVNQIAYFNNYLNCRMDFLSELTFGIATMQTSRKVYSEVFKELDRVRLLLNHISGIVDFKYSIDFQYNNNSLTNANDKLVAFPSDLLGCQALYNIIENIIRNTAKHCHYKPKKTVFTIKFKDIPTLPEEINDNPNLLYCVEITDGININGIVGKLTADEKIEYCKYIEKKETEIDWGNLPRIDWLVDNQNIKLNQSVLGKDKQLRSNSLGLLEMEASAAFLRQIELYEIESDDYQILPDDSIYNKNSLKLNIIKAYKAGDSQNGYSLGYRIFLKKPQEMLFVGNWKLGEDEINDFSIKLKLLYLGIWFRQESDFLSELDKGTNFNHQFVLHDGNAQDERLKNLLNLNGGKNAGALSLRTRLPLRIIDLKKSNTKFIKLLKDLNYNNLEKEVWLEWIRIINSNNSEIIIHNGYDSSKCDHIQIILFDHTPKISVWEAALTAASNAVKPFWMDALKSNGQSKLPDYQSIVKGRFSSYIAEIMSNGNAESDQNKKLIRWKIYEAYKRKVIVIDERIQNFSAQDYGNGILMFQIYERSGVILPPRDVEIQFNDTLKGKIYLDGMNYDDNLVGLIECFIEENIKTDADFLLIHYGILERMYKNQDSDKISEKLRHWSEYIRVIVTSGRGKQSLNLPPEVCYINFSSITYAFMDNTRNKYSINYLLNQARR